MPIPDPFTSFGSGSATGATGTVSSTSTSTPAYARVSGAPSWMPSLDSVTGELRQQYADTARDYSTSAYDQASGEQQSRVLTTSLNAGNNAATAYANKARQEGGSGMGAGLIKAEAGVAAQSTAGDLKLKQMQYDAEMRDKAATHATAIASTLGNLRDSYLHSLVDYATKEDATSATATTAANDLAQRTREWGLTHGSGGYTTNSTGNITELYGNPFHDAAGMPTSNTAFAPTNRSWGG